MLVKACRGSLRLAKIRQGRSLRIAEVRCGPLTTNVRQGALELATMHYDELKFAQARQSSLRISNVLSSSPRPFKVL